MTVVKITVQKAQKTVIKRKPKIENYSSCLEATQFENKINHLKKIETDVDSPKKVQKEFIKNSK